MTTMSNPSVQSMTVQEARSVFWLSNNYRPLGELLDEGFLNEDRLAWAAKRAYDARLKAAAGVLLDWMRQNPRAAAARPPAPGAADASLSLSTGISVEQARSTVWPFPPFKSRRMGELVDTHQLTFKDLGYAIDNAWDERVRRSAMTMMALRLNQKVQEPTPPAGPLCVISAGKSYSERRELAWTSVQGAFVGGLSALVLIVLIQVARSSIGRWNTPGVERVVSPATIIAIVILLAVGIALGWLLNQLIDLALKRMNRAIKNYQKGREGEDRVVDALRQGLDGKWTLFRNITLPGRNQADLDAVLVGPPGIWALEIKNLSGEYRNIGEHWEVRGNGRQHLLRKSPSRQAQNNAARLSSFFRADGIGQWVTPVVVWAAAEGSLSVENPSVAVWTVDRLSEELGNLMQNRDVPESDLTWIVDKLTKLGQSQNEEPN